MAPRSLRTFVVDAFTAELFKGNPAGVVMCGDAFLSDAIMQRIAAEMNHAETAFLATGERAGEYRLRWFTPAVEVDLCGHATLAAGHVLFSEGGCGEKVTFQTRSGVLVCERRKQGYTLDFPALLTREAEPPPGLLPALRVLSAKFVGRSVFDVLVELESEEAVRALEPEFDRLREIDTRGVIVTAAATGGAEYQVVSRFFGPRVGVDEDPVTGSAHCALAPYYADRFGNELVCLQASARTGVVRTELRGDRVLLKGAAITFLRGEISVPSVLEVR